MQVRASNHSVTISWRKPETARQHAVHVVEWYPEGHKLEELRWIRLGRNDNHAVITGGTCKATVNAGEIAHLHNVLSSVHCRMPSFFWAGIKPFECYEGAVYVVYADSSVSRTRFTGVTTLESGKIEDLNSVDIIIHHLLKLLRKGIVFKLLKNIPFWSILLSSLSWLVVCSPCSCSISPRESWGKQSESELDGDSQGAAWGLYHQLYHLFREWQWRPSGL